MPMLKSLRIGCAVCVLSLTAAIAAQGQAYFTLYSFCAQRGCPDGQNPSAGLAQGTDGNFYGTAGNSTFRITPAGTFTTLVGSDANQTLLLGSDGNFYGSSEYGGLYGGGSIYKMSPKGVVTTLYNFCQNGGCTDGEYPQCTPVEGADGNFYGTTYYGGEEGYGTVFKLTPGGTLTTLHFFTYVDGAYPLAGLVQANNGNFYGTTSAGYINDGTVFEITPSGTLTTVHDFTGVSGDGSYPLDALIQGTNGNLYGTTLYGGAQNGGEVFEITPGGTLTTLYSFCAKSSCSDGADPVAGVAQGTDGNFYGTTKYGGGGVNCVDGCGVVYRVTPEGTETVLHTFVHTDGVAPVAALVQGTDGLFYGTAYGGGANDEGSVFALSGGFRPFVKTVPATGNVGKAVIILGNNLTGASSVTFNGTPATFTVQSATAIKTSVPAGATSGPVRVVTLSGTLTSNVNFQVVP